MNRWLLLNCGIAHMGIVHAVAQELLQDREKSIPPEERMSVAKHVKETYCYCCPDIGASRMD